MKNFVKRNNKLFYAANQQVANWIGRIGPLSGLSDSYLSFLQHKRNRIDGWAIMWWAWTNLSKELKNEGGNLAERKQKVAAILNIFIADMEEIHTRFEMQGAFMNYDFWINVESWADEFVSSGIDRTIPASMSGEHKKLRETLHHFWVSFLDLQPGEARGLMLAGDQLRNRVYEIFDFSEEVTD